MKNLHSILVFAFLLNVVSVFSQTSIGPLLAYRFSTFNKDKFLVEQFGPEGKFIFYDHAPVFGLKINQNIYKRVDLSVSGSYYKSNLKDFTSIGRIWNCSTIGLGLDLNIKLFKRFKTGSGFEYNFVNSDHWPYTYIRPVYTRKTWNYNFQVGYELNKFLFEAKFFHTFPKHGINRIFNEIYGFQFSASYNFPIIK